jgi:hypothetical protein
MVERFHSILGSTKKMIGVSKGIYQAFCLPHLQVVNLNNLDIILETQHQTLVFVDKNEDVHSIKHMTKHLM